MSASTHRVSICRHPLRLITLYLILLKTNHTPNINIISFCDISLWGKKISNLYLVTLSSSLRIFSFLESLSLSLSLCQHQPKDNHPKAKFSIKSVTLFHSLRVISGIMHTNHSNTKLFLNSPHTKINPDAQEHSCTHKNVHCKHICANINKPYDADIIRK